MKRKYQIGDFCFSVEFPEQMIIPENMGIFETKDAEPEYSYRISFADQLPVLQGTVEARRKDITVLQTDYGEVRYLSVQNLDGYYACYREITTSRAEIIMLKSFISDCRFDPFFNSFFALEKRILSKSGLILHSSYIVDGDEAILFSAPSETGKSTQADLWQKYRGSHIVNGDRALLQKINGIWIARGWPVCGTSEICHREDHPVRCIVMMSQAKTDTVRKLSAMDAFRMIYSQITINGWNQMAVLQVMDLLDDLIASIPVYHLSCTISENAVQCLEKAIYENGE